MHLVLCEQRNGKSAVVRSLSPSQRQAACCTSGTAIREQDERDNDADVACVLENVEHPAQVLLLRQDRVRSLRTAYSLRHGL
jgi:hypothetical protein